MTLDLETLSDSEILDLLRKAQAVPKKGELFLQRYPVNQTRNDTHRRNAFRVWADDKALLHLIVGRSLKGLHQGMEAFCQHNPGIGCRALFFIQHGGIDFLGQECPGLLNLSEALATKQIDAATWQQAVQQIASALATTTAPSTQAARMQEMKTFEQSVLAMVSLTRLDQIFLRDTVFPLIRQETVRQPLVTAWTNGDFIAKNILLDTQGHARLIDYEFAHRTHFPSADWFRLGHFSSVPESIRLEDIPGWQYVSPELEIRGWLEHAVKMNEVCLPAVVQADLPGISGKLARLVEAATGSRHDSVFFSLGPPPAAGLGPTPAESAGAPRTVTAQLFFPEGNAYVEEKSTRIPLKGIDAWLDLVYEIPPLPAGSILRFDPVDQPGVVEIASLTLEPLESTAPAKARSWLTQFTCEGDSVLLANNKTVSILSWGTDAVLKLAPLDAGIANLSGRLRIRLRYSPAIPTAVWTQAVQDYRNATMSLNLRLNEAAARSDRESAELQQRLAGEIQTQNALRAEFAEQGARLAAELAATRTAAQREQEAAAAIAQLQDQLATSLDAFRTLEENHTKLSKALHAQLTTAQAETAAVRAFAAQREQEAIAAVARLQDQLTAGQKTLQDLEEKQGKLIESLHAQNARLLDAEHQAELAFQEHTRVTAELAAARRRLDQLQTTIAKVRQRPLVRLDRQSRRLIDGLAEQPPT